jgi:hypothetical protein
MEMTRTQRVLVGMIVTLVVLCVGAQVYRAGENRGYQQGWSDAGCGVGKDCEAGQE